MTKLFKNSKQMLSFVIAFAVFAVSLFTAGINITSNASCKTDSVIYWSGNADSTLADNGETGTANDPIIIDTAEELFYLARKATLSETNGKYFKVADGVDKMILQPKNTVNTDTLLSLTDSEAVKDYLTTLSGVQNWDKGSGLFNGNFDGNGVEIYGLYAKGYSGGLFYQVDGGTPDDAGKDNTGVTYKNFAIRNSYFETGWRMGAIAAFAAKTTEGNLVDGTINIDMFELSNCYMTNNDANIGNKGIIIGGNQSEIYHITNCLLYGNYATSAQNSQFDIANGAQRFIDNDTSKGRIYNTIENSVIIGTKLTDGTASYASNTVNSFENVFTDMDFAITNNTGAEFKYTDTDVKLISASDLIGSKGKTVVDTLNAANAGNTVWYIGNDFGYLGLKEASILPENLQTVFNNITLSNYDDYKVTDGNFGIYATSLNVKANPYIAFTFMFGGEYKTNRKDITVTFKNAAGNVIKTTTVADADGNLNDGWTNNAGAGKYHLYRLTGIDVKDLTGKITVEVKYGSNAAVEFGSFSVEGFAIEVANAYRQDPCKYYLSRLDAAKSLLFYAQMVNTRYGATA